MAYDRYRHQVVSLMHFDEADGAATTTDERGRVWTFHGSAGISTDQARFGDSSLYMPDSPSNYLSTPSTADIQLGGGAFTIEAYVYLLSYPTGAPGRQNAVIAGKAGPSGTQEYYLYVNAAGVVSFAGFGNGTGGSFFSCAGSAIPIALNEWHHVAATRLGDFYAIWIDGVSAGSLVRSGNFYTGPQQLFLGRINVSGFEYPFHGYIDEFRITRGVARYTDPFAPPASAFELRGTRVNGIVKKGDTPTPAGRKIILFRPLDQLIVGTGESDPDTGEYEIETDADVDATLLGMAYPDYGEPSIRNHVYALGDRTWIGAPAPLGHWYECEQAGTTGATEPTWPTDGSTVEDGTVIWRDKGVMERPWAEGPYIAEAV